MHNVLTLILKYSSSDTLIQSNVTIQAFNVAAFSLTSTWLYLTSCAINLQYLIWNVKF